MGKSPGKWIKTVLLGRKNSKSNLSKGVKVENNAVPEQPEENLHLGHPLVTDQSQDRSGAEEKSEKAIPGAMSSGSAAASLPVQQQPSVQQQPLELNDAVGLGFTKDEDTSRLELAAIKAQAAFRGYLARRAFWALKGIIRLQALIRGHLVRRQAVATLHCVHYIVKLQALVRGRMVRISYPGLDLARKGRMQEIQGTALLASLGMSTAFKSQKLSTNAFAVKLVSLLPKAMPLSLQYGPDEPNSAWTWLQRWSLLHFWEPFTPPKAAIDIKSQAKLTVAAGGGDKGKSKRTLKKVAASTMTPGENTNSTHPFEFEKPKRNPRKLSTTTHHQIESSAAQEQQAQSELEKVKRNLRKVSAASSTMAATTTNTEKPEIENGKPLDIPPKLSDVANPGTTTTNLLPPDQTDKSADDTEMTLKPPLKVDDDDDEPVHLLHHPDAANEQNSSEIEPKVVVTDNNAAKNEESDQTETENQKTRRRKSLPVKQEYHENVSQNSASVPSYMAATESAKAKLRLQAASIKLSEDGGGENGGFVRRHSLPNPGNGKLNSISPRVQKPGQVNNGKGGGIKTNKSLSASREERVFQPQPGWRR